MPETSEMRFLSLRRIHDDICVAAMMLTRLPVPASTGTVPLLKEAMWAFPFIGLIVGAAAATVGSTAIWFGVPPLIAAILTVAGAIFLTGALHEDGLADMADGFGAGGTATHISSIMKDSQIGTYGAVSLVLIIGLRVSLLAELSDSAQGLGISFILACMFGRGMAVILCSLFPVSTFASLGQAAASPPSSAVAISCAFWLIPLWFILGPTGIIAICLGGLAMVWTGRQTSAKLNGITGDTIGASILLSETGFLLGLIILAS